MKIESTKLPEVMIIEPTVFGDNRGWFMESYSQKALEEAGIKTKFVQDNHSYSATKGTLRGLHFQNMPESQTKLVRCIRGKILDVVVDIRVDSPTYKQWIGVELSAENKKQLFVSKGFAHGFVTLADDVEIEYKVDNYYSKEHDRGIRFDDPELGVDWGVGDPVLSDKDKSAPLLKDSDANFIYKEEL